MINEIIRTYYTILALSLESSKNKNDLPLTREIFLDEGEFDNNDNNMLFDYLTKIIKNYSNEDDGRKNSMLQNIELLKGLKEKYPDKQDTIDEGVCWLVGSYSRLNRLKYFDEYYK